MSYDIYLRDPVTGETAEVPGHLMVGGTFRADYHPETGTFTPALNTELADMDGWSAFFDVFSWILGEFRVDLDA